MRPILLVTLIRSAKLDLITIVDVFCPDRVNTRLFVKIACELGRTNKVRLFCHLAKLIIFSNTHLSLEFLTFFIVALFDLV